MSKKLLREDIKTKDIGKVKDPKGLAAFMKNYSDTLNQVNPQLTQKVKTILPPQTVAKVEPSVAKAGDFIKSMDSATQGLQADLGKIQKDWERNNTFLGKLKGGASDIYGAVKAGVKGGLAGAQAYKPAPNMYNQSDPSSDSNKTSQSWINNRLANQNEPDSESPFLKSLPTNDLDIPEPPETLAKNLDKSFPSGFKNQPEPEDQKKPWSPFGEVDPEDKEVSDFIAKNSSGQTDKSSLPDREDKKDSEEINSDKPKEKSEKNSEKSDSENKPKWRGAAGLAKQRAAGNAAKPGEKKPEDKKGGLAKPGEAGPKPKAPWSKSKEKEKEPATANEAYEQEPEEVDIDNLLAGYSDKTDPSLAPGVASPSNVAQPVQQVKSGQPPQPTFNNPLVPDKKKPLTPSLNNVFKAPWEDPREKAPEDDKGINKPFGQRRLPNDTHILGKADRAIANAKKKFKF